MVRVISILLLSFIVSFALQGQKVRIDYLEAEDSLKIGSNKITEISNDAALADSSGTAIPTEAAVKGYVDNNAAGSVTTDGLIIILRDILGQEISRDTVSVTGAETIASIDAILGDTWKVGIPTYSVDSTYSINTVVQSGSSLYVAQQETTGGSLTDATHWKELQQEIPYANFDTLRIGTPSNYLELMLATNNKPIITGSGGIQLGQTIHPFGDGGAALGTSDRGFSDLYAYVEFDVIQGQGANTSMSIQPGRTRDDLFESNLEIRSDNIVYNPTTNFGSYLGIENTDNTRFFTIGAEGRTIIGPHNNRSTDYFLEVLGSSFLDSAVTLGSSSYLQSSGTEVQVLDEFYVNDPSFTNGWLRFDARGDNSPRITFQTAELYRSSSGGLIGGELGRFFQVYDGLQINDTDSQITNLKFNGFSGTSNVNIFSDWNTNDINFNFYNDGTQSIRSNFQGRMRIGDVLYGASNTYEAPENGLKVQGNVEFDGLLTLTKGDSTTYASTGKTYSGNLMTQATDGAIIPMDATQIVSSVFVDGITDILSKSTVVGEVIYTRDNFFQFSVQADTLLGYATDSLAVIPTGSGHYAVLKPENMFYPEMFGATSNDDSDDDGIAFQKACDFIIATGNNKPVWIGEADEEYEFDTGVILPFSIGNSQSLAHRIAIWGTGGEIRAKDSIIMFQRLPTDQNTTSGERAQEIISDYTFDLRGITFTGPTNAIAIKIGATYKLKIEECQFLSIGRGIDLRFALVAEIANNVFTNCRDTVMYFSTGDGVWPGSGNASASFNGNDIRNNRVFCHNDTKVGIYVAGDHNRLVGNVIEGGHPDVGIALNFDNNTGINFVRVQDTWFEFADDTTAYLFDLDVRGTTVIDGVNRSKQAKFWRVRNNEQGWTLKLQNVGYWGNMGASVFFDVWNESGDSVQYDQTALSFSGEHFSGDETAEFLTDPSKWSVPPYSFVSTGALQPGNGGTRTRSNGAEVHEVGSFVYRPNKVNSTFFIDNPNSLGGTSFRISSAIPTATFQNTNTTFEGSGTVQFDQNVNISQGQTLVIPDGGAGDMEASDLGKTRSTYFTEFASDGTVLGVQLVVVNAAAPSVTPTFEGQIYVDTTNDNVYIAKGTASSADWVQVN